MRSSLSMDQSSRGSPHFKHLSDKQTFRNAGIVWLRIRSITLTKNSSRSVCLAEARTSASDGSAADVRAAHGACLAMRRSLATSVALFTVWFKAEHKTGLVALSSCSAQRYPSEPESSRSISLARAAGLAYG